MTFLENLAQQMLQLCHTHAMPQRYGTDLAQDIAVINNSGPATMFVWLIRESGTNIMPVGQGVDPTHIAYYLEALSTRKVFLVNVGGDSLEISPITDRKAVELINLTPQAIFSTGQPVWPQVKEVLQTGIDCGWWGMFHRPETVEDYAGIEGWLGYFHHHGNEPMSKYLKAALAAHNKLVGDQRTAA